MCFISLEADFDRTLTKFWVNGRMGYSCHMVIAESDLFSQEYHRKTTELRNRYYPMEASCRKPIKYSRFALRDTSALYEQA